MQTALWATEPSAADADIAKGDVRVLRVFYARPDGVYQDWGLHAWGSGVAEQTEWERPLLQTGHTSDGCYWDVPLGTAGAAEVGFIVHAGDNKSAGGEMVTVQPGQTELWLADGLSSPVASKQDARSAAAGSLAEAAAHWVDKDTVLWRQHTRATDGAALAFSMHASPTAGLTIGTEGVTGAAHVVHLVPIADPDADAATEAALCRFPHLRGCTALRVTGVTSQAGADGDGDGDGNGGSAAAQLAKGGLLDELVASQLCVSATREDGSQVEKVTGVQMPGVLDEEYYYSGPLGDAGGRIAVWAPTAQSVQLLRFASARGGEPEEVEMTRSPEGAWSCERPHAWDKQFYMFRVTVYHHSTQQVRVIDSSDPYARGLAANGARAMFVDLDGDASLEPEGWWDHQPPPLQRFNDISIYELHVRDFSASDTSVPEALRGKYLAFDAAATGHETAGQAHLSQLSAAGLSHLHLLPTYDFGSVPERAEEQLRCEVDLSQYPPDSDMQQAEAMRVAPRDAFNWGYDPVHYGVPEGSYATDPDAASRLLEFRRMVQAVHGMGLRVVQDVVYNHTFASGLDANSVLDKVVPGYYHRRTESGDVCNSTCCNNTAMEHRMAERLMIDDLVHWATHYKVDGFRFDIMGHIMVDSMVRARAALDALTLEQHGVDGSKVYLYGEAWDFGEVACNQRGRNACQLNIGGTRLGAFNDRVRDALIGGSPFAHPSMQGFLTGVLVDPNPLAPHEADPAATLRAYTDWLKLGLAGNLADYTITTGRGDVAAGRVVPFNGVPAAYCAAPAENIVYLGCHDNEALYDAVVLKANHGGDGAVVARVVQLALGLTAVAQGVPFFHAGDDLLRSKSLDRDSYDSGDWFNRVDWTGASHNFGVGLPPAGKNADTWHIKRPLLGMAGLKASATAIAETRAFTQAMLRLRYASPLFRLARAEAVIGQVSFENNGPGAVPALLVMVLRSAPGDAAPAERDPEYQALCVIVNAQPGPVTVPYPEGMAALELHPAMAGLQHVQGSAWDDAARTVSLGARTLLVLGERW